MLKNSCAIALSLLLIGANAIAFAQSGGGGSGGSGGAGSGGSGNSSGSNGGSTGSSGSGTSGAVNPGGTSPDTSGRGGNPSGPAGPAAPNPTAVDRARPNRTNDVNVGNSSSPGSQQAAGRNGEPSNLAIPSGTRNTAQLGDGSFDFFLSTCIALGKQEELALARLGLEKADNDEVRAFAEQMEQHHQEFLSKLQKLTPDAVLPVLVEVENKAVRPGSATEQKAKASTLAKTEQRGDGRLTQIEREFALRSLASSKEKLSRKSGPEFDRCFMALQVAKHTEMKDKLDIYQHHVSAPLARLFSDGLEVTEQHLAAAEKVNESIAEEPTAAAKSKVTRTSGR